MFRKIIEPVRRFFTGGDLRRHIAVLSAGTVVGQAVAFAAMPVLTRLFTPADFGSLSILESTLAIVLVVSSPRYELAIPIAKDDTTAANVVSLSLAVLLVVVCGLAAVASVGREALNDVPNLASITPFLWLVPAGCLVGGVQQIAGSWGIRRKHFGPLAKARVAQSTARVTVQLGLGGLKAGALGLLLGDLAGRIGGAGWIVASIFRVDGWVAGGATMGGVRAASRRYVRFPVFLTGASFLNAIAFHSPPLLMTPLYGSVVVGQYGLAMRTISAPISLLGAAVSQVFWSEAALHVRTDVLRLREVYLRLTKKLALCGVAIAAGALVSPWFFGALFGAGKWEAAGEFAACMAPLFALQMTVSPLSHLGVHELQHWQFGWDLARVLAVIACFGAASRLGIGPKALIATYAWILTLLYVVLFALNLAAIRRAERLYPPEADRPDATGE